MLCKCKIGLILIVVKMWKDTEECIKSAYMEPCLQPVRSLAHTWVCIPLCVYSKGAHIFVLLVCVRVCVCKSLLTLDTAAHQIFTAPSQDIMLPVFLCPVGRGLKETRGKHISTWVWTHCKHARVRRTTADALNQPVTWLDLNIQQIIAAQFCRLYALRWCHRCSSFRMQTWPLFRHGASVFTLCYAVYWICTAVFLFSFYCETILEI